MKKILIGMVLTIAALAIAPGARAQGVPPSVTLNWTASTTAGVAGYNVFRAPCTGTVSGTAVANGGVNNGACSAVGTFSATALNAAPVAAVSYIDTTVSNGVSYVYEVEAVCPAAGCSTGITGSSAPSSPVAVTLPTTGPLPPTNLTGTVTPP
jgi:hypothetical protein